MFFVLMFSNVGLAVNLHYCKGVIEKIELGYGSDVNCDHTVLEKSCCQEKKDVKEDCCTDEIIKQSKDDVVVQSLSLHFSPCILVTSLYFTPHVFYEQETLTNNLFLYSVQANAPPLYKLYQQFLIYA